MPRRGDPHCTRKGSDWPFSLLIRIPTEVADDLAQDSALPGRLLGFDLVRSLPVELHLLHLLGRIRSYRHGNGAADEARRQLRALVPDELGAREAEELTALFRIGKPDPTSATR